MNGAMVATAKTIQLFLMDGSPKGRLKASLGNWTGVTYLLPRTNLALSNDREDLRQTGVYLLFGTDDEGVDKVYIGQARERKNGKGVLGRISEHIGEEKLDYWTHAVALITSNDSFGPTEISYLENRFNSLALLAKRYVVTNGNDPSQGKVTEEKQAELDEFINYARLVIGALGYRVFEPVDEAKSIEQTAPEEPTLYMSYSGVEARGRQTSDGFVVLAGSELRPENDIVASAPDSVAKGRIRHASKIVDHKLTEDVLFKSPSGAAAFVGGASLSGSRLWRDESGRPLGDLEKAEVSDKNRLLPVPIEE